MFFPVAFFDSYMSALSSQVRHFKPQHADRLEGVFGMTFVAKLAVSPDYLSPMYHSGDVRFLVTSASTPIHLATFFRVTAELLERHEGTSSRLELYSDAAIFLPAANGVLVIVAACDYPEDGYALCQSFVKTHVQLF